MTIDIRQALAVNDIESELIDVSKWWGEGAKVRLKKLSLDEYLDFSEKLEENNSEIDSAFLMLRYAAINDDGSYWIQNDDQLRELKKKSLECLKKLFKEAYRINSFGDKDQVEQKAKN